MSPVEARSLASLITLASNPPQYPRNPTAEPLEPLVLYIARVPGSKDIFLTTMKPRQKVVTAEDVSSCLYFLHFEQASDGDFVREVKNIRHERQQSNTQLGGNETLVPRKPIAARPPSSSTLGDAVRLSLPEIDTHGHAGPSAQQHTAQVGRKPVARTSPSGMSEHMRDGQFPPLPPRRPVGSRPNHSLADSLGNTKAWNECAQPLGSEPPPTPNKLRLQSPALHQNVDSSQTHDLHSAYENPVRSGQEGLPKPSDYSRPFDDYGEHTLPESAVTLIRRDPGSGAQWNVGLISNGSANTGPSLEAATDHNSASPADIGNELELEIPTPGYKKFVAQMSTNDCGYSGQGSQDENFVRSERTPVLPTRPLRSERTPNPKTFKRTLVTENTGFWDRSRRSSRPSSSELSDGNGDSNGTSQWKRNSAQHTSTGAHDYLPMSLPSGHPAGRRQSLAPKARGYVFLSPWGGRCEFATGRGGRTIKCKHTLPATSSGTSQSSSASVSELRFNLPSSVAPAISTNRASTPIATSKEAKRSSLFRKHASSERSPRPPSGFKRASQSPDERDLRDDPDILDLSLGQENAGGGFGGKKAKLGKLIIDGEGLKMLDLVVAANMGIWWKAYQRVQGDNG
ncbi:MAG: hypothetical protein M1812_004729 [Candelaria pacifica]|nr:MAG: hypothetical protein M1812_004729 [Candelaria pacifica]